MWTDYANYVNAWMQKDRQTDRRTDRQTDRQIQPSTGRMMLIMSMLGWR